MQQKPKNSRFEWLYAAAMYIHLKDHIEKNAHVKLVQTPELSQEFPNQNIRYIDFAFKKANELSQKLKKIKESKSVPK